VQLFRQCDRFALSDIQLVLQAGHFSAMLQT
jgi:hypothetical protein